MEASGLNFLTKIETDDSYKAPEMFLAQVEDQGTYGFMVDAWAIGVIIYQLWQRKLPFVGNIENQIISQAMPK